MRKGDHEVMELLAPSSERYVVRSQDGVTLLPDSYFVIRADDLFASAGLWAYVHAMETVLEYASQCPPHGVDTGECDGEIRRLRALCDRAAKLAATWQASGSDRLPA